MAVTGTIGVLDLAARRGLVDLEAVFAKLKRMNIRYPRDVMDALLARYRAQNR